MTRRSAFVGRSPARAPDHPDIVVTGTVSEADKWDILAGANLHGVVVGLRVVLPGAAGGVDARGPGPGQRHLRVPPWSTVRRSGGGLCFASYRSFEVAVDRLWVEALACF